MLIKIIKIAINLILFFLIILGGLVFISASSFSDDFRVFVVKSGSMEPAIRTGSLIFTQRRADYQVGEIVTRKTDNPKTTVTHRIVEKIEKDGDVFFKTKGDANDAQDFEEIPKEEIVGRVFLKIPYIGFLVGYAQTKEGFTFLIVVPAVIIIYDEINNIKREIKKILEKRQKNKEVVKKETE